MGGNNRWFDLCFDVVTYVFITTYQVDQEGRNGCVRVWETRFWLDKYFDNIVGVEMFQSVFVVSMIPATFTDKLLTAREVQQIVDILPSLEQLRALERVHEDRSLPTMALVIDTILRFCETVRKFVDESVDDSLRAYGDALMTQAAGYFSGKNWFSIRKTHTKNEYRLFASAFAGLTSRLPQRFSSDRYNEMWSAIRCLLTYRISSRVLPIGATAVEQQYVSPPSARRYARGDLSNKHADDFHRCNYWRAHCWFHSLFSSRRLANGNRNGNYLIFLFLVVKTQSYHSWNNLSDWTAAYCWNVSQRYSHTVRFEIETLSCLGGARSFRLFSLCFGF